MADSQSNHPVENVGSDAAQSRRMALWLSAAVIATDQLSKWWILVDIMNPPQVIELTPFFNLVLVWNRGVSFGLFNQASDYGPWILAGLALAICVFLYFWLKREDGRWAQWAIGLIIGGAIGNVIDRGIHGAVVDFIDLHAGGHHWPAFNVADSAITVGAVILILDSLFRPRESS